MISGNSQSTILDVLSQAKFDFTCTADGFQDSPRHTVFVTRDIPGVCDFLDGANFRYDDQIGLRSGLTLFVCGITEQPDHFFREIHVTVVVTKKYDRFMQMCKKLSDVWDGPSTMTYDDYMRLIELMESVD